MKLLLLLANFNHTLALYIAFEYYTSAADVHGLFVAVRIRNAHDTPGTTLQYPEFKNHWNLENLVRF